MKRAVFYIISLFFSQLISSQHNNEFFFNDAIVHIESGAEIHVNGDVLFNGGNLTLNGLMKTQGNSYANTSFQQRGTGTYRIQNSNVNTGEEQFLSGSFAVRGGQSAVGMDDGSFYNLELDNDQGVLFLVGSGNVADIRNSLNFSFGGTQNRIVTHDIRLGTPANGADYDAVFGIMSSATGLTSLVGNTITINGNMTTIDNGYVQGKLRRAISTLGGSYPFVIGLEPAGLLDSRGVQYASIDFESNTYDVVTAYFQQGSDNSGSVETECNYGFGYFQGTSHGEWVFQSGGSGVYELRLWPQGNFPVYTIWTITKDRQLSGDACDHSPSTIGISRGGFNGFSTFGIVGGFSILPVDLLDFGGQCKDDQVQFQWRTASEVNNDHFIIQGSHDGLQYENIESIQGMGTIKSITDYELKLSANYLYYRLIQVDFDGKTEIFQSVFLPCNKDKQSSFSLFPNPTSNQLFIQSPFNSWTVTLYDLNGKILFKDFYQGREHQVNLSKYDNQSLIISLHSQAGSFSHRIIVD
ncbi:MAG: T9SS type A sorting domain-containing protein [Cyclobacteriaceae bacterium]